MLKRGNNNRVFHNLGYPAPEGQQPMDFGGSPHAYAGPMDTGLPDLGDVHLEPMMPHSGQTHGGTDLEWLDTDL